MARPAVIGLAEPPPPSSLRSLATAFDWAGAALSTDGVFPSTTACASLAASGERSPSSKAFPGPGPASLSASVAAFRSRSSFRPSLEEINPTDLPGTLCINRSAASVSGVSDIFPSMKIAPNKIGAFGFLPRKTSRFYYQVNMKNAVRPLRTKLIRILIPLRCFIFHDEPNQLAHSLTLYCFTTRKLQLYKSYPPPPFQRHSGPTGPGRTPCAGSKHFGNAQQNFIAPPFSH